MFEKHKHAKVARRRHTQRRAYERYGMNLTNADYAALGKQIERHHALRIQTLTHTKAEYAVTLRGETFRVVYSHSTNQVITVLPKVNI
jgi:hypothetical protein